MPILIELLETFLADPQIDLAIILTAAGVFVKLFLSGVGDVFRGRRS